MPLPKPKKGQSKKDWDKSCMANSAMNNEFPDSSQRYKVCQSIWNDKKKDENIMKDDLIHRLQKTGKNSFELKTLNEENRSVEVIAATEKPAKIYDPERYEVVDEVLLMSGAKLKDEQIPLTVEHYRSAEDVIGSLRDIVFDNGKMTGRVYFSAAEDAEKYWTKVKENHLNRFSITYSARDRKSVWIDAGQTANINGKTYKGPLLVTTEWQPKSLGLVLYAADDRAKARSTADEQQTKGKQKMDEKLRKFLERCGLSPDATEKEAWDFYDRFKMEQQMNRSGSDDGDDDGATNNDEVDVEKMRSEAVGEERDRILAIDALCEKHEAITEDHAKRWIREGISMDVVNKEAIDLIVKHDGESENVPQNAATIIFDENDKFRAAAEDALVLRSSIEKKPEKPAIGANDLMGFSCVEIARHCLRLANKPVGGRALEVIGRALTTSDFPYILANVANKALFEGWETNEETWQTWVGTGSVPDFKTNYSVRIGELSDLEEVPEDTEYKYGTVGEAQETYQVVTYGKIYPISRQTLVNDDLNAITDLGIARGEAASRKVGDVVYAVLTANAAMGDAVALFHSTHANYVGTGSGAAPGTATIGAGILAMGTQKDISSLRRLNIRPVFFIAPKALEGAAEVFFQTMQFADSDTVATDSSLAATRKNIYSGNYFTRVYEPRLDDDVATQWYLAARKGKTVKAFFLDGIQKPYTESKEGWTVDGIEQKVRIDCGAKAMDWRGLYCNYGA